MYEQGVRTTTIDRITGWAPRTVRERHYIRIAPKTMHDAIQTIYRDDPICPEQALSDTPRPTHAEPPPERWQRDLVRLVRIEKTTAAIRERV
jgi:hypothetical protein